MSRTKNPLNGILISDLLKTIALAISAPLRLKIYLSSTPLERDLLNLITDILDKIEAGKIEIYPEECY
jgi:hypothetical protein